MKIVILFIILALANALLFIAAICSIKNMRTGKMAAYTISLVYLANTIIYTFLLRRCLYV